MTTPSNSNPADDRALFAAALATHLHGDPEVAKAFAAVFQGDPVGPQWLASVAQQTTAVPGTGPDTEVVLLDTDELLTILDQALEETIWPTLVDEFGEDALLADPDALVTELTDAITAELGRLLAALATEAETAIKAGRAS